MPRRPGLKIEKGDWKKMMTCCNFSGLKKRVLRLLWRLRDQCRRIADAAEEASGPDDESGPRERSAKKCPEDPV